jgi:hypothetical protein
MIGMTLPSFLMARRPVARNVTFGEKSSIRCRTNSAESLPDCWVSSIWRAVVVYFVRLRDYEIAAVVSAREARRCRGIARQDDPTDDAVLSAALRDDSAQRWHKQ